jgi:hypothetical protein
MGFVGRSTRQLPVVKRGGDDAVLIAGQRPVVE